MKILIASRIDEGAVLALGKNNQIVEAWEPGNDIGALIGDCDALVFRSGIEISEAMLTQAPNLKLIIRAGSGLDNIDLVSVHNRGIRFERIPKPGARAVAELAFALMLALARQLFFVDAQWRQGVWVKNVAEGHLLAEKTLGIVGIGNIGGVVGAMGVSWGMNVVSCVASPSKARAQELASCGIELIEFTEVLKRSDFISLHVPLDASTRGMIDGEALALMKPNAFLINLARGGVVDEFALREALLGGRLRGAGLDVHAQEGDGKISPLADLPNVILTPHIGATTVDSQRQIGERIVELVNSYAES